MAASIHAYPLRQKVDPQSRHAFPTVIFPNSSILSDLHGYENLPNHQMLVPFFLTIISPTYSLLHNYKQQGAIWLYHQYFA
jgi:hypothetical protein